MSDATLADVLPRLTTELPIWTIFTWTVFICLMVVVYSLFVRMRRTERSLPVSKIIGTDHMRFLDLHRAASEEMLRVVTGLADNLDDARLYSNLAREKATTDRQRALEEGFLVACDLVEAEVRRGRR